GRHRRRPRRPRRPRPPPRPGPGRLARRGRPGAARRVPQPGPLSTGEARPAGRPPAVNPTGTRRSARPPGPDEDHGGPMSTAQTISPPTARDPHAPTASTGMGADRFRSLLSQHAAGVVIVTADVSGEPVGLTATSFTSVSLSPPLVAFYIADSSRTWPRLRKAGVFAVHLLGEEQRDLAVRFAAKDTDRFAPPTVWSRGA